MGNESLKNFIFTVQEYMKFAEFFHVKTEHGLLDEYSDKEYIAIQTKLMLLRKYGSKKESVYLKNVLERAKESFNDVIEDADILLNDFDRIQKDEMEIITSEGESINLYKTIENVMYGLYLHADTDKIEKYLKVDKNLWFVASRKYVEDLEKVVFKTYNLLYELVDDKYITKPFKKAPIIAINEDKANGEQGITGAPFWGNVYGKDANAEDFLNILRTNSEEDNIIFLKGIAFINEALKEDYDKEILSQMVFPPILKDWGDFSSLHSILKEINKPGWNSRIRYNARHDMAYMYIYHNVENAFTIDRKQIISGNISVLTFVRDKKGEWKIYCFGDKLDDYLKHFNITEWFRNKFKV